MLSLNKIKRLRKLSRFTQAECGESIGVGRSEYCKKEGGEAPFSVEQIEKLADFLNVPVVDLFDDKPKSTDQIQKEMEVINSLKGHIEVLKKINDIHEARIKELESILAGDKHNRRQPNP